MIKKYKDWLQNVPMKKKLIPTQVLTVMLVVVMSLITILSLATVNTLSRRVFTENVDNTEELNDIIATMYMCRVTGRDILFQDDTELRMELYAKYLGYFDSLDSQMDAFHAKLEGEKSEVFAQIILSKNQYKDSMILSADLKNEGNKDVEALEALRSVTPIANEFFGSIENFLEDEKNLIDQRLDQNDQTLVYVVIAGIAISVLVIVALFVVIKIYERSVCERLATLQGSISEIVSTGDAGANISKDLFTNDEIGLMAKEMKKLADMFEEYADIANTLANKDYRVEVERKSEKDTLAISLDSMIKSNNNVMIDIKTAAENVSYEAKSVFENAQTLESGVILQANSVEQLSELLKDITEEIGDSSNNSQKSVALGDKVSEDISTIEQRIKEMMEAMSDISASSKEISRIITTIEDISFQTNVLALNAAVEAARAGTAGKGFSVVADEVRNLANKSSEAAKQTAILIEGSVNSVENGERMASSVAQALLTVTSSTDKILDAINSIRDSTGKQIVSIDNIHKEVDRISEVVQSNKDNSNHSTNISQKLNSYAMDMTQLVSDFTLQEQGNAFADSDRQNITM